jgi:hypothetical protein
MWHENAGLKISAIGVNLQAEGEAVKMLAW